MIPSGILEVGDDFAQYDGALRHLNDAFPQKQGLMKDEYGEVVDDPRVVSTPVMPIDGNAFLVPQLAPVEAYSWLNSEFYAGRYPKETAQGDIMHFQDIPGVIPGIQVMRGIQRLARSEGRLIYDYPDSKPGYPDTLRSFLSSLGVKVEQVDELGTQTYFAGKVRLERGVDPNQAIMSLSEACKQMQEGSPQDSEEGTMYLEVVDEGNLQRMQDCYSEAFAVLNDHPCRQGLTPEEFREVAVDQPQTAKLVHKTGSKITSMCVLGDDLSLYPWLNQEFYASRFPEETKNNQILYFPAMATDPENMGARNAEKIVSFIAQMLDRGNNEAIIAFDCCDMNVGFLDAYLDEIINKTPEAGISFETLGVQHYGAMQLSSED
jgi:hypothetical protein